MTSCREEITKKCRGTNEQYCYPLSDNKYVLLECTGHVDGYIYNSYVQKIPVGYLEFHFYNSSELPLSDIKLGVSERHRFGYFKPDVPEVDKYGNGSAMSYSQVVSKPIDIPKLKKYVKRVI